MDELQFFGDEGAGPEEAEQVINDPENQEVARLIRESTFSEAIGNLEGKE